MMPQILWVGPGWYKRLTFAVGNSKVTQVSQNKDADVDTACVWCDSLESARLHFQPKLVTAPAKREVY